MAPPEDKVKLFDDDPKTPPSTTVVDENEEGSDICQLTCVSVVFLVVFGVFFSLVIFPSSPKGEDSYYDEGLYISQHSFFSFTLPLRGLILGSVSRKFYLFVDKTHGFYIAGSLVSDPFVSLNGLLECKLTNFLVLHDTHDQLLKHLSVALFKTQFRTLAAG